MATFIPSLVGAFGWPRFFAPDQVSNSIPTNAYHLHPTYRRARPLDALLLKTQSGSDEFVSERYADEIAIILATWTTGFLASPLSVKSIAKVLARDFTGCSLRPRESRMIRPGPEIEIRQNSFDEHASIGRDTFVSELAASMRTLSRVLTADLQVTAMESESNSPPNSVRLRTSIRYELVGTGHGFWREQRVGNWQIVWERLPSGEYQAMRWTASEETQSRSSDVCFLDVSAAALGHNDSFAAQLMHGSDYWRTILDGASGIDIYGHNGVSVGDFDGDGFDDIYVCQPGGIPNRLYKNRGDGTFDDITEQSGVGVIENTACALFVDVDNDGRQDLIVVRANGPLLFLNEGDGTFRQKAGAFNFSNPPQGTFTGAAVADYDRDGWLDIYFCLYVYYQGTDQYKYPSPYYAAENGPPNFMMRNHRDGTFSDVTAETGLNQNNTRYSFCCGWNDFNHDGWPDLYVVNDFGRKNLYRNNGNGTFTDIAAESEVEDLGAGMSVCWFDYDNDGREDLYVADMWTAAGERVSRQTQFKPNSDNRVKTVLQKHAMGNSLFHNEPPEKRSRFTDQTIGSGTGIGRWAWSSDAWDFNHDGFQDLYIVNGMVSGSSSQDLNSFFWRQVVARSPDEAKPSSQYEQAWAAINELIRADGTWSGYERNIFYANNGEGKFSDISGAVGLDFMEDARSFALSDFDHDGRQEAFLKNRNAPQLRVLKNVMKELPPSIVFCLRGVKSNRDAIGAVITLQTKSGRQTRSLQAGSGFLSQHSKEILFGLGNSSESPLSVSIKWPSGLMQEIHDLPINHRIFIEEGLDQRRVEPFLPNSSRPYLPIDEAKPLANAVRVPELLPEAAETWLLAPIDAPDFSLLALEGQAISLASLRGGPVLLHFWATAAEHSMQDLRSLNRRHKSWLAAGLHLVSVNVDDPGAQMNLPDLLRDLRLSFPILRGSEEVAAIYNILYRLIFDRHRDLTLPTSFLINSRGEIVKLYQGPLNVDQVERDVREIPEALAQRVAKALPFRGVTDAVDYGRNYLSYGSVYFQRGHMDQAAVSFRTALRDDPTSAEAMYGLGSVYLDQQKSTEARDSFKRALHLNAAYPDTMANSWNNLGLLAAREGRKQEAADNFQQALKLSPDHSIALVNLGSAYRQLEQWQEAGKVYEHAIAVNPNDPEANYGLGMVYAQAGDTQRAFDLLQLALKLRPEYPEALNNLGILYLRTERRDQAVATFEECIRIAPAFDQAYLNLARIHTIEGHRDDARVVLRDLLKQHPNHPQAKQMLEQLGQ